MKRFEHSSNLVDGHELYMAFNGTEDVLVDVDDAFGFTGEVTSEGRVANLTHETAKILRRICKFTAPKRVLGEARTFGCGDRLGLAAEGHIKVFERYDAYPILVQQSIRELNLTHRRYEDVLDAATFASFKFGYKKGFGADGDHLKTDADIEYALGLGFTMITLDCSEHIGKDTGQEVLIQDEVKNKYLDQTFDLGEGVQIHFDEDALRRISIVYDKAIDYAVDIYSRYLKEDQADFEVSIDETDTPTTPQEHFYVAKELVDRGVKLKTIAPRFCGEFQKGIDYIGDLKQFEEELILHGAIAKHFGYKISVHSGSDKFKIFGIVGDVLDNVWHVKTAGTNWLEALRVLAIEAPSLYRQVHTLALERFLDAKAFYHVTTDISKIKDLDQVEDKDLFTYLDQDEARQVLHITYGYILDTYKKEMTEVWQKHQGLYASLLESHIGRHLEELSCPKMNA